LTNLTKTPPWDNVVVMHQLLNLYDAKARLSALVDEAAAGAEIIIAKNGKPRARLVPIRQQARREPGAAKGKIWISQDFDAPLPDDLARAFGDHHE